jgi:glycosyltransferase involved in cell wall biosynthesis
MAALTHGMPIVTTHPRGPVPQLRDGENILLVPPQDPRALSVAITRLANDPGLRRRLGDGAQALAREFEWGRIAARTLEVFHELAGY